MMKKILFILLLWNALTVGCLAQKFGAGTVISLDTDEQGRIHPRFLIPIYWSEGNAYSALGFRTSQSSETDEANEKKQ